MSDTEEHGKTELDDQSMDEVYDMADDLDESVDTVQGSPVKPESMLLMGKRKDAPPMDDVPRRVDKDDSDDEPPEIPGSPMKMMTQSIASSFRPSTDDSDAIHSNDKASSSSSSEDEYETDKQSRKERIKAKSEAKTPPKPHEAMRDALKESPSLIDKALSMTTTHESEALPSRRAENPSLSSEAKEAPKPRKASKRHQVPRTSSPPLRAPEIAHELTSPEDTASTRKKTPPTASAEDYPSDIQRLLQYVDEFKPEVTELPTYVQAFVPDYVPSIGSPYEGAHVLRPDDLDDPIGVQVLAEPGAVQSNVAELQLMLKSDYKPIHAAWELPVLSIEHAHEHPEEINAWITSVAKVQASKPLYQVHYSKPMPSIDSLMDVWPEDVERLVCAMPTSMAPATLNVTLPEYIRIVCGVLDIPVHNHHLREALHVLFTVYEAFASNPHFAQS
ncbi:Aste57867_505 [Aphanomyces stellatus]|uniref:Aste57867_505 protein n=1 Tax=Aphanomyces stellatus TaxID=120398 RepID=A0A485K2Z4_9STRA|nr:hypothetical protein As57867_000504 [Aphanomyces stellatus]VFT77730.1 Aste57867_505 [Aphanomyces stellatus]